MNLITVFDFEMISWFQEEIGKVTQADIEVPSIFYKTPPEGSQVLVGRMHDSLKALFYLSHKAFIELQAICEQVEYIQNGYTDCVSLKDLEQHALLISDRCDFLENLLIKEVYMRFPDAENYSCFTLGSQYEVYGFNNPDDDTGEDVDESHTLRVASTLH